MRSWTKNPCCRGILPSTLPMKLWKMQEFKRTVVSKGYAESKNCLSELVAMMGSGKPVIPVFYDVEPAHLRRVENGPFSSAFEKHKSRETAEQVQEWTDALRRLADVTGLCFRLSDYNGDEAELKQRVVVAIRGVVPRNVAFLPVERHLVGLEDHVRKCVNILESMSGATGLLGLVGMGGIGKTCLAKEIFNRFVGEKKFQAMSFLEGDYGCSEKLFNQRAFGDERGPEKFRVLAEGVSKACGGLPLALKVVGRSLSDKLCDEDEPLWVEAIDMLGNNPDVVNALAWSYKCLSEAEKLMFLDIACFLYGRKKREALEIWKSCKKCSSCCGCGSPETSLRHLIDKCLVEVVRLEGEDTLGMHNLIQELGKDIGYEDGSHLWEGKAEKALLDRSQGANQVRALNLVHTRKRNFKAEDLAKMTKLLYLVLDGCTVGGNFGSSLEELRWLQWRKMPSMQPPLMLDLFNLTSLDFSYSSNLASLWTESSPALEACPNLGTLNLEGCASIMMLSDSIRHLSRLQVMQLGGCSDLQELPSSIGELTTLQELTVHNCKSLGALLDTIIALPGLQKLGIRGCSSMSNLPTGMRLMRGLTFLDIDVATEWKAAALGQFNPLLDDLVITDCTDESRAVVDSSGALRNLAELSRIFIRDSASLTKAPETIGVLTNLKYLRFQDCGKLRELPDSIGQLKVLMHLLVRGCNSLETLPDSLGELTSLQSIAIVQCISITKLPTSIGQLSGLTLLALEGCSGLQTLPDSLSQLNALRSLRVLECGSLEGLGGWRVLQGLRIWGCTSITELMRTCLVVMVDHSDWFWYWTLGENTQVRGEVRDLRRLETNDCGYLRHVEEAKNGRTMVQRVHQRRCVGVE